MQTKLSPTTKDIATLYQMHKDGQLIVNPDYQRDSVWPVKAKAYLVDTILANKPIPMIFLHKTIDSSTNRMAYRVIDGQQRLRTVFAYIEGEFRCADSDNENISRKRFSKLSSQDQQIFWSYDFVVMELFGFDDNDLRDIFTRMNRYVVRLNAQELRHAEHVGPFARYVSELAKLELWTSLGLFTPSMISRQQHKELIAELVILLLDGPQDKKGSVDTYYEANDKQFEDAEEITASVVNSLGFIIEHMPGFSDSVYKRRPGFYGLMGALFSYYGLDADSNTSTRLGKAAGERLIGFSDKVISASKNAPTTSPAESNVQRFITATSRQTDNLNPRTNCIRILMAVIEGEAVA